MDVTPPFYEDPLVTLRLGDCLQVMAELPDASVDAVVTDPPYSIGFMGREWDKNLNHGPWAREAFRVAKPGAHLLAFGGTRTYHRLASAIEDAGWEIRDCLVWAYASGFPKSLDVSKALDRTAGAERTEYVDPQWLERYPNGPKGNVDPSSIALPRIDGQKTTSAPATDLARQWDGWGTALKPAWEPIVMARKPLIGSIAQNVTRYGVGALNIGATRIPSTGGGGERDGEPSANRRYTVRGGTDFAPLPGPRGGDGAGRWPPNLLLTDPIFDGDTPGVVGGGETSSGFMTAGVKPAHGRNDIYGKGLGAAPTRDTFADSGTYSRFFLVPKADRSERERGLNGAQEGVSFAKHYAPLSDPRMDRPQERRARANHHPTVKPIDLMRHLVHLVTPPGGVILDPFLGSGTTALAASEEGFRCLGIEKEPEYLEIAKGRLLATPMGMGLVG